MTLEPLTVGEMAHFDTHNVTIVPVSAFLQPQDKRGQGFWGATRNWKRSTKLIVP